MRTTPLVCKIWIFGYSVVGLRLTLPPLAAAPSPHGRRALSSCQSTGSANQSQADWMTLFHPALRRTHYALGRATQRRTPVWGLAQYAVRPWSCPSGCTTRLRWTHCAHGLALEMESRLGVGKRRSSARVLFLENCKVRERERNAVRQPARRSPTSQAETALQQ